MNFEKQINSFISNGNFDYQFDSVGNVILETSSSKFQRNYLAFKLSNFAYDIQKIEQFSDSSFKEFIPEKPKTGVLDNSQIKSPEVEENEFLKSEVQSLTSIINSNISDAERQASRDVIVELRIKNGEGKYDVDFSQDFPYLPLPKNKKE